MKNMAKYSASVATTIPVAQAEKLDEIAKQREITRSTLIRLYIEKGIESEQNGGN
jgi:predicted DNA-binding protein